MPKKRARGEGLLERALEALATALDRSGAPWMIIGGIAVIAHGVRRFTTDIDAAVRGDAVSIAAMVKALAQSEIRPRIPDAAAFARANLVLLVRHEPTGVDLDVSMAWSDFEHEALDAAKAVRFGKSKFPMTTPADLVVFKAIAGRARDMDDIEALLVLHPGIDVRRARERIRVLAVLAEAPELLKGFDAVARRARPSAKTTRPAKSRPRRSRDA